VPFELALVAVAKRRNVRTLGVQHGDIYPGHVGYIHVKGDISQDGSAKSPFFPIPDKTAVFGPHYQRMLRHVPGYPRNSVVVTGQPRYDRIHYARKIYSRTAFLKRYRLNIDHKIVLWTTQCWAFDIQENIRDLQTVFEAMQNVKGTTLIIKQHPGETKWHTDLIKTQLQRYELSAILTPKNSDTYEQLFVSDLTMTIHSTTAMEAVAMGKPLVILKFSPGEPDSIDYVGEGVAVGVHSRDELVTAVHELLRDPEKLSANRSRFVEKYLFKVDGKSTDRVTELVDEMLRGCDAVSQRRTDSN
jgi:UDP-N-acetylglucosamine 2-epimerase